MNTGSHVLGAFNIDFDSFVDNVVFCALIDRVGKYQLAMQKISAYKPMAESMPQMLREEAFHLAAGVVPMRRWVTKAAQGRGLHHHGRAPEGGQQVAAARPRDVRRRARRRHQRALRPEADEERRGAAASTTRRSRSWSATSTCATCGRASRSSRTARPRRLLDRILERGETVEGVAPRGPAAPAAPGLLPPPRRARLRWSASTGETLRRRRRPTSATCARTCPRPTSPAATSRTTSTRLTAGRARAS